MGDNCTPQLREQSSYGYWISARGGIINVEQKDGHISLLMDRDEFIDLSPTQPYSTWYETALLRGWVRIIAPVANRQQFRFQFRELSPDTRTPLIWLIGSLTPYREYILEASTYKVFYSPQDASRYIEQCCGPVGGFSTASWTTSSSPGASVRDSTRVGGMAEHDVVRLVRSVRQSGVLIPPGARGTIVSCNLEDGQPVGFLLKLSNHDPVSLLEVEPADIQHLMQDDWPR